MTIKSKDDALRLRALELLESEGATSARAVARELGVHHKTVQRWARLQKIELTNRGGRPPKEEEDIDGDDE